MSTEIVQCLAEAVRLFAHSQLQDSTTTQGASYSKQWYNWHNDLLTRD